MNRDIENVLFTETDIRDKILELGYQIAQDYAGKNPILICILKGAYVFTSDLSRAIDAPHSIEFMRVKSYENTQSTGKVNIVQDIECDIAGRHVIVVEDILDTHQTLVHVLDILRQRNPASLEVAVFISKPANCSVDSQSAIVPKYLGFKVDPPEFVIGYGLDYNEIYRNLPFVGTPTKQAIERGQTQ